MRNISRVLCVLDPTSSEQAAVERAAWVCGNADASLELLICYHNEYLSGERYFDSPSLEKARKEVTDGHERYLEELAEPLRDSGIDVTTRVVWDRPLHEGIVRYAAAINADLVIKDTRYHSSIARAMLSNTDWQLIRNCASPLWLVKPVPLPAPPVFISAIDPMNEHDKPAALDDQIIVSAKRLAELGGGEVYAFHAYDPSMAVATASANAYLPVSLPYDELDEQMREKHGRRFYEITEYHDIGDDHTRLVAGRTEDELPSVARELGAAVVVMGAVARNRLKRLFVGSTAERTLDHLPCDLLIVKPDWFACPAEILRHKEQAA